MKRKPHPIKGTVKRFLSKRVQQWAKQRRQEEAQGLDTLGTNIKSRECKKKAPESEFVKFMNGLEKRGPDKPFNLYDKWTITIRERMEARGSWPTGMQDWTLDFLAEYLQELMKQFWKEVHPKFRKLVLREFCVSSGYTFYDHWLGFFDSDRHNTFKGDENARKEAKSHFYEVFCTYRKIHNRIRMWGYRRKLFILPTWQQGRSLTRNYIDQYPEDDWLLKRIWSSPKWRILYNRWNDIHPTLIMIHKIKMIENMTDRECVEQRIPESMTHEDLMTALFEI
jgi:hypothetical protein